jgi:LuxR family maltose regulon positive regulatory protein
VKSAHTISAPAPWIDRPELLRLLDGALAVPMTLIVAPVGAGKSTLLAQWIDSTPALPLTRLDLDEGDNDPVRCARRLLDAFRCIDPLSDEVRTLIRVHTRGLGGALIDALGHELERFRESIFVIDDLHRLSNRTLLADLSRLLTDLPPHIHVVVSSRTDPPFAVTRHRAEDQLLEIRQHDLALSAGEAGQLLNQIAGAQFSTAQIEALVERTEGWAAGLQLAAVTLRHHDDPNQFIAQFNGTDRLVVDYLTEEILQLQTPERRQTLLKMSVLDQMSADLVNNVTGQDGAQLLFEDLERESMFLVPLDTTRTGFRFHQLFQDMLRYRLRALDAAKEPELLGRAATWHLERGQVHPAVEYLLRAQDWERLVDVIMTQTKDVYERGEMLTVIRWIEEIPEAVRARHVGIWILLGMLWGMEGQTAKASDILNRALADPRATSGQRKIAAAFISARVYFAAGADASVAAAERARHELGEDDGTAPPNLLSVTSPELLQTLTLVSGARAHLLAGNADESSQWMTSALNSAGISYPLYAIGALGTRALIDAWAGRLVDAQLAAHQALSLARQVGGLFHAVIADAHLALAQVALEQGRMRDAAGPLHEGIVRSAWNRRDQLLWISRLQTSEMHSGDGYAADLESIVTAVTAEATTPPPPAVAGRLVALRARHLRLRAAPEAAARAAARGHPADPDVLFETVAAALTMEHNDRARSLLAAWTRAVDDVPLQNVQHLILRAWLAANEGDRVRSQLRLLDAFDIAQPEGLIRVFVRAGATVLGLTAALTGSHDEFRRRILDRAREAHIPLPDADLADPLTDRELQILTYLPSRYKNSELADLCFVSLSTIKTHLANIYRKLDATTRDDAIARAQELGLL